MGRRKGVVRTVAETDDELDRAGGGYPDKRVRRAGFARGLAERLERAERARAFREGRLVLLNPLQSGTEPLATDRPLLKPPSEPLGKSVWDDPDIACPWSEEPEGMDPT